VRRVGAAAGFSARAWNRSTRPDVVPDCHPERDCLAQALPRFYVPEWGFMTNRLYTAMGMYAVLAILAATTLDGVFRLGVLILLGGFALKTLIAYKAGWRE
jgi:hypothetical protein